MSSEKTLLEVTSLIADCPHSTPEWTSAGVVVLRNQHIKAGRLQLNAPSYTDEKHYLQRVRRAKPTYKDIVLTREAPIGQVCQVPKGLKCCLGQRQVLIRADKEQIDPDFLFYSLRAPFMQRQMLLIEGEGTTVSNLRIPYIEKLKLTVPAPEIQKNVVMLLNAVEGEMETLRHQNTALESIAQTLFRSWFVDFDPVHAKAVGNAPEAMSAELAELFPSEFEDSELGLIPKGWRLGRIGDIGQNPRTQGKPTEIPATTPYIGLEHMPRRSLSIAEWGSAATVESGKFWFTPSDILFGKLRPYFHKVGIANMKGVCSTDILVIRSKEPNWHAFLVMHLFSKAFIEHATQLSDGARMPRTNWSDTAAYRFALPPADLAKRFNRVVQPMFALMAANVETIRLLASLRDHVLPRLISGKLRLEDAEASIAAITSELEAEPA